MRRSLARISERYLPLFAFLIWSCEGGLTAPAGRLEVQTAFFDGVEVTPVAFHLAWGGEGIQPASGFRFYTIEVMYFNNSASTRRYDRRSLKLRTEDGRLWDPLSNGRTPMLESGTLIPGERVTGWVTFEIPMTIKANGLVWIPHPFVSLTIPIQTEFPM
jgi:hypothetical protein